MASVPVWRGRDGRLAPEDRTRVDAAIDVSENLGAVIGDVEAARDVASDHAEDAGASADIALDAVAISRAQADGALASAVLSDQRAGDAATAAGAAELQRQAAEAARAATQIYASASGTAARFFDTIALGRAAVADGFSFGVRAGGSNGLDRPTIYRRDSATTQTLVIDMTDRSDVEGATAEANYRASINLFVGTGPEGLTPPASVTEGNLVLSVSINGVETTAAQLERDYRENLDRFVGTGPEGVTIPTYVSEGNRVIDAVGRAAVQPAPDLVRVIEVVAGFGQSNERGQAGATRAMAYGPATKAGILTLLRGTAADVWLGLTGQAARLLASEITGVGLLVPGYDSSDSHGTVAVEGFARKWQQMREVRAGTLADVLVYTLAQGGQSIDALVPNTPVSNRFGYANLVAALQAAQTHRPTAAQIRARIISMCQGEADTGEANLGALHDSIRAQYQIDARAITGQADAVRMISWQPSSFTSGSTAVRSLLSYALANAGAGLFFCGGPTYPFVFSSDYLHQESIGHALRGEMNAVIADIILATGVYLPLHMTGAAVSGPNQITVTLSEAAAVETNAIVTATPNLGLGLVGGTITAAALSGSSIVLTTTAAASAVTAVTAGLSGQGSPRTPEMIPRTNIRAAASIGTHLTGAPMRKWLCHQQLTLG